MERCDIVIPVWNELEATRECVESILRHTDYPYRLIIIDNASAPDTAGYLRALKEKMADSLMLVRNEENLGFIKAVNQGLARSDAPFVCIMNNDTVATAGWLRKMADVLGSHPEIGLLNPSSNTFGQFPEKGESVDEYARRRERREGKIQELHTCRGFCMLMRREVPDKIGGLDETYSVGYFDDADYSKRTQAAGFGTARAKEAYVYHKENTSFKNLENNKDLFKDNEKIYFKRWGRPVRVAYLADGAGQNDKIDRLAQEVARKGHQILIFLKKRLVWPVKLDHFDIRRVDTGPAFFGICALYSILKRKRKKKVDILLTDNEALGSILKMFRFLHEADVFIKPDTKTLFEALDRRTKIF